MAEELGFRTPAKELEKLRERVKQIEGLSTHVRDALTLSSGAFLEIFSGGVARNPKDARRIKDDLLDGLKRLKISPWIIDMLDDAFKAGCEAIEEHLREKNT